MRKLYTLLAGLALIMFALPANARSVSPDAANFTFTIDPSSNAAFANTSTLGSEPGARHAQWIFGDGTQQWTGALDGTQHHYNSPGTYTVCLKIYRFTSNTNDSILTSQICKTLVIESACGANFETVAANSTPLGKYFVAQPWHAQNKKPVRICWTFGDNRDTCIQYSATSTGPYAVYHSYTQPGTYNVCVNILYDGGCEAHNCHTITTGGNNADSCHANFEMVAVSSTPLGKYFVAQPWHSQTKKPVRICWTFGDNRDTCIQYTTASTGPYGVYHSYTQAGTYNVCVNILYDGGCQAQSCHTITTGGDADSCRADFERLNISSVNNLSTLFRAIPSHNHNKKPSRICWQFGDNRDTCINYGQDFTGLYMTGHTYSQPGQYNVCVKILYFGGCEATKCKLIEVNRPDSCRADFERIPITATNNTLTAAFRPLFWHNNQKKPQRICWTFGDNTDTCINYGQDYTGSYIVNHNYQQPGQYNVCVKILYYGGCEATKCKIVGIPGDNNTCSVNIFEVTPSLTSLTRGFYASVTSSPNQPVQSICWRFGDGNDTCITPSATTPPALNIQHTFPGPGVYHVCVRVVFQGGCVGENCKEIIIRGPNSDACGGYMTDSLTGPRTYKFKGFAIHNPNDPVLSYRWTFGDGTSAVGPEVMHTYNNGGEYRVCLTINTQSGCETRICNTVRIVGSNQTGLILSPNPVHTLLHALFFSTHTETVTIKITNSNGVVVRTYTKNAVPGANNWDFDVANLLPGIYLFTVQSPNQLASAMFLKI